MGPREKERGSPPSEKIKKETQTVKMRGTEAVNVATTSYRPEENRTKHRDQQRRCEQKHLLRIPSTVSNSSLFRDTSKLLYMHKSECISSSSNSRYGLL